MKQIVFYIDSMRPEFVSNLVNIKKSAACFIPARDFRFVFLCSQEVKPLLSCLFPDEILLPVDLSLYLNDRKKFTPWFDYRFLYFRDYFRQQRNEIESIIFADLDIVFQADPFQAITDNKLFYAYQEDSIFGNNQNKHWCKDCYRIFRKKTDFNKEYIRSQRLVYCLGVVGAASGPMADFFDIFDRFCAESIKTRFKMNVQGLLNYVIYEKLLAVQPQPRYAGAVCHLAGWFNHRELFSKVTAADKRFFNLDAGQPFAIVHHFSENTGPFIQDFKQLIDG